MTSGHILLAAGVGRGVRKGWELRTQLELNYHTDCAVPKCTMGVTTCISYFLLHGKKIPDSSNQRKEGIILAHGSEGAVYHVTA